MKKIEYFPHDFTAYIHTFKLWQ